MVAFRLSFKEQRMRFCSLCFLLWQSCMLAAWADASYILDNHSQQHISVTQLLADLAQADVVLLGEKHDEAQQHQLQLGLLQHSRQLRPQAAVLLEMLASAQQRQVDRVKVWMEQGGKTGKRGLAAKMAWNSQWDWTQYQDLLFDLMPQTTKVLAANPDPEAVQQAAHFVPQGPRSSDLKVRTALAQIMGQSAAAEALVGKQQYKDQHMAQALLNAPKPAWLIAGAIHCSKVLGVPLFLADAGYRGQVKVLIMTELGTELSAQHADYIWFIDPNAPLSWPSR
jgi:uncharacterized iron-regulated protein